jgi:hypothetical protein
MSLLGKISFILCMVNSDIFRLILSKFHHPSTGNTANRVLSLTVHTYNNMYHLMFIIPVGVQVQGTNLFFLKDIISHSQLFFGCDWLLLWKRIDLYFIYYL